MTSTRLVISPRHLEAIARHAAAIYPEECCGILIGRELATEGSTPGGALVERILSAQNSREESRQNRYVIDPRTVLAAHKEARALGLDVVGYYHSHPDHPAEPSELDRENAWPGLTYLIVSVEKGEVANRRSWRLTDDRTRFIEEEIASKPAGPKTRRDSKAAGRPGAAGRRKAS